MSDILNAAVAELEQAIKTTAARDGVNLDDPSLDIFPKQRDDYVEWMRSVLAVVEPMIAARAAIDKAKREPQP
jgi:hypothetical protein